MHCIHANVECEHEKERIENGGYASKCLLKTRKPNNAMIGFENIKKCGIGY